MLTLLYIALIALILWSVFYLIRRIVRALSGKGSCSCSHSACRGCLHKDRCTQEK